MNSYMDTALKMGGMDDYLSWYCDNGQHLQCEPCHPRSLGRCTCRRHEAVPAQDDGDA